MGPGIRPAGQHASLITRENERIERRTYIAGLRATS